MSDFEQKIHDMFDYIWDCDIYHPLFESTVGELMEAVIQCYNGMSPAEPEIIFCKDCKYWQKTTLKSIDGKPVYDCPYWPEEFGWTHPEGFCSGAERRTDDQRRSKKNLETNSQYI